MKTKLITYTQSIDNKTPEQLIEYCARVSSPENQTKDIPAGKLINYCKKHKHWSIFEMVDVTFEIETSIAISKQILRHRSFSFQEFSARYSKVCFEFEPIELRLQDFKNKQNSIEIDFNNLSSKEQVAHIDIKNKIRTLQNTCEILYQNLIEYGIAKEVARFILPQNTTTRLYMKGSVRSWLHYLEVRTGADTQKEHRLIALEIQNKLSELLPTIFGVEIDN
jgi:thymidylate synthase (FAD)